MLNVYIIRIIGGEYGVNPTNKKTLEGPNVRFYESLMELRDGIEREFGGRNFVAELSSKMKEEDRLEILDVLKGRGMKKLKDIVNEGKSLLTNGKTNLENPEVI
ncbi:MAG: hypothetical protein CMH63_00075 [Nanoarchaeota archaeon]|jgi:hypothetical protein|nr:hypothetical protein [Nanoarchaeota archaeon]|tara:strand:- start:1643 stop:1954 length:312 start_codon:yes stop_codon:yes gene_type:complete